MIPTRLWTEHHVQEKCIHVLLWGFGGVGQTAVCVFERFRYSIHWPLPLHNTSALKPVPLKTPCSRWKDGQVTRYSMPWNCARTRLSLGSNILHGSLHTSVYSWHTEELCSCTALFCRFIIIFFAIVWYSKQPRKKNLKRWMCLAHRGAEAERPERGCTGK